MNVRIDTRDSRGAVIGLAAGAMLAVALSQLATTPTARADNFTEIFDHVQFAIGIGQNELATAASDFAKLDLADGLSLAIAGWDDTSLAPQETLLVGTFDALMGHAPGTFDFGLFPPNLDLATAMTDAQAMISEGQGIFTDALTAFGNADLVDGLDFIMDAYNDIFVSAPQELLLGSVDSLLGL